ncbi:hypothetical protein SISNIDRAFT_490847 [Sistotremastrum niveocremeum HHB9708]|uniref:Uncharacterized protein n=1 Tax=Sistotremastrum niveocremeum HHB9708 TaxID=1314777 RepID=A0A164NDQ2_9AGAM|nr:hypothetical protein SISNIDRAFT_490847 [Sistotremastrum niveocremeum HHB9708]
MALSHQARLGLGLGIGLGVPFLLLFVVVCHVLCRRPKLRKAETTNTRLDTESIIGENAPPFQPVTYRPTVPITQAYPPDDPVLRRAPSRERQIFLSTVGELPTGQIESE